MTNSSKRQVSLAVVISRPRLESTCLAYMCASGDLLPLPEDPQTGKATRQSEMGVTGSLGVVLRLRTSLRLSDHLSVMLSDDIAHVGVLHAARVGD